VTHGACVRSTWKLSADRIKELRYLTLMLTGTKIKKGGREGQLAFIQCKRCGCRGALATKGKALAIHVKTQANGIRDPKVSPRRERLLQTHVHKKRVSGLFSSCPLLILPIGPYAVNRLKAAGAETCAVGAGGYPAAIELGHDERVGLKET
jgi:hypothetical protein